MSDNPYCMRCGEHLGMPFHETNEHDDAARLADESESEGDRDERAND